MVATLQFDFEYMPTDKPNDKLLIELVIRDLEVNVEFEPQWDGVDSSVGYNSPWVSEVTILSFNIDSVLPDTLVEYLMSKDDGLYYVLEKEVHKRQDELVQYAEEYSEE